MYLKGVNNASPTQILIGETMTDEITLIGVPYNYAARYNLLYRRPGNFHRLKSFAGCLLS